MKDIEFARPDGVSLKLDVRVPEGNGPFPMVILVHGGAWTNGDKQQFVTPLFAPLTEAKFTWFTVNYRLAPRYPFPACVEDVEAAVRWAKLHAADYKGDPARVALVGESAGGHIASLVALRATPETKVNAVVAFYTPFDMQMRSASAKTKAIFGIKNDADIARIMREASPLVHVKRGSPPFLLLHGTGDQRVQYEQSVAFQKRLRDHKVPCELITIKNGPHGMSEWDSFDARYKAKMVEWLAGVLGPKN